MMILATKYPPALEDADPPHQFLQPRLEVKMEEWSVLSTSSAVEAESSLQVRDTKEQGRSCREPHTKADVWKVWHMCPSRSRR